MLKQNAVFTDEELMDRIRNCDRKCFEELYDRYHKRLFNFILRIVNDREKAEDFLHDVFIKVMESHDRFDVTRKFSTWIYTLAINLCRNEMRNQLNRKQLIALNFIPDFISPAIQIENILGQTILTKNIDGESTMNIKFPTDVAKGVYMIRLIGENAMDSKQIVLQ
ncbi:hypothetical protein LBMAG27_10250 [Bacteroidota bacterium]|nr:hypothetical protein LBMAG27_10250 [Bacteroidota bacterium]